MQSIKVIGKVALAFLVFLITVVVVTSALDTIAEMTGIAWLGNGNMLLILFLAVLVIPARYRYLPIPFRINGTAEIEASPAEVWQRILPRPGYPYHGPTIARIEAVPGTEDEVILRLDDRVANDQMSGFRVRIEEEIPGRKVALSYPEAQKLPLFGKDVVRSETRIEQMGQGRCRVTFTEYLRGFRPSTLLIFVHLNPAQDAAGRLKALCEGTKDPSWMGRTVQEIGPNGEPPESVQRSIRVGFGTWIALTTLVMAIALFLINNPMRGG